MEEASAPCQHNSFCSTLDPEDRAILCQNCSKRQYRSGAVLFYEDYINKINFLITGALVTNTRFDADIIQRPHEVPAFFLVTEGIIYPTDALLTRKVPPRYAYNNMVCLTDCTIATLDPDCVDKIFDTKPKFARDMYYNLSLLSKQACEFAALLRSNNVYESVRYLLQFLTDKNVVLTQQQIADITSHNRTSITKTIGEVKRREPKIWERYQQAGNNQN